MKNKTGIVTFKVDKLLAECLSGIANKSDFIRDAVLLALGNICPLCNGSGTLSVAQRTHWDDLVQSHRITTCGDCKEPYLVCDHETYKNQETRI